MHNPFPVTGDAPRVKEVQAVAFHDRDGRIRHMHHAIVLEGARSLDSDAVMRAAREEAAEAGVDVSLLEALHVTDVENPHAMHRVDVQKRVLVEVKAPPPDLEAGRGRDTAEGLEQIARSVRAIAFILVFVVIALLLLLGWAALGART